MNGPIAEIDTAADAAVERLIAEPPARGPRRPRVDERLDAEAPDAER